MAAGLALAASLLAAPAHASSVTIYGTNGDAHTCYNAAKYERATRKNILACDEALASANLFSRDRAAVLVNRGILHRINDDIEASWADYKAALTINPKLPEAWANRGNLFFLYGHFENAIADYDAAVDFGIKNQAPARLNKAMALGWLGRDDEARAGFEDVIRRYPDWQLAKDNYRLYQKRAAQTRDEASG